MLEVLQRLSSSPAYAAIAASLADRVKREAAELADALAAVVRCTRRAVRHMEAADKLTAREAAWCQHARETKRG